MSELNNLFKEAYDDRLKQVMKFMNCHNWTVDRWIKEGLGTKNWEKYPNAVAAKKIMDSKLYKVMK